MIVFFLFASIDLRGCSDDTIPAYTGPPMQVVHAAMGVTNNVFDTFNRLLLGVLTNAGVTQADVNTVGTVLVCGLFCL